jgi:hypothetical protein
MIYLDKADDADLGMDCADRGGGGVDGNELKKLGECREE